MGFRFVIGRAGSGKSRRIFDRIVAALRRDPLRPAVFWILPRQLTFTAERELTCASGLPGFCRGHILSFDELGREVLDECGGAAVPHVTELGRQMILGHLLRKHEDELRYFRSVARQPGLAAELDATFAELERFGRSSSDLSAVLTDLESTSSTDARDQALVAKLHDLRLLYDAYAAYLGQERLDPHRRLAQVLECIESWGRMQGADVYVDAFIDFTDYERRVIAAMAKTCRRVEVSLMMDATSGLLTNPHKMPDELAPFFRVEDAYRRLWFTLHEAGIEPQEPVILPDARRFANPALAHVEQHLLTPSPGTPGEGRDQGLRGRNAPKDPLPSPLPEDWERESHPRRSCHAQGHEGIALIEAPDRRAEVDAAARQVRAWAQRGMRYRDIAVLARDLSEYHELIDASFREHEIPHFIDRRRAAAHHPLLQFTRGVFLIALHNWPHDAAMTLLKSGLCNLSFDEADELENYVLLHRIRGDVWMQPDRWTFRRKLTRDEEDEIQPPEIIELDRIDQIRRRVVDHMRPLITLLRGQPKAAIRQIVTELFALYQRFDIRRTLSEWMRQATARNDIEQHDEHQQVWTNLIELFDQMVELMGDEDVKATEFLEILEFGLERFDLALTPPTVDQVLVGAVDRTRNPQSRAVILLGMNDGQFPRVSPENSILSDAERRSLRQRRLELDRDSQRQLLDESLLGYVGFTRASHQLTLTRAIADEESRPQAPSVFWLRLRELFPDIQVQSIPRDTHARLECIGTSRQLLTHLMRWVRASPDVIEPRDSPWPALYQWLATHECCDDALDAMRHRSWKALSYTNEATLSKAIAERFFRDPLRASVTRLETFAACPFRHFARYGLELERREQEDVTALDLGNVYHEVLEKIVREMVKSKRNWTDLKPEQREAAIKAYSRQVGETLRGELMLSGARNRYLLQRIEKTLSQVIATHQAAARRSRLRPLRAELGFGLEGAELPPYQISTPSGREALLYGKIDRVDLIEDHAAFAVIDYKLRGNTLDLQRVYHGLALQLLTYLLVLQANADRLEELKGKKLTPAAAFYVKLMRQLEKANHPEDAIEPDDPLFDLTEPLRGILDGQFVGTLDTQTSSGWATVIKAYVKKDGELGNRRSSDAADRAEFTALLRQVERRLAELADQILDGNISIAPYRLGQQSPCAHCDYRSVCRFDLLFNQYHHLESMGREQVLERVVKEGADGR